MKLKQPYVIAVIIGIFTVGISTQVAINNSGPGTKLHVLETDMVEPAESTVAISDGSEAQFWAERFAERLSELETITNKNDVDQETIKQTRHNINQTFNNSFDAIKAAEAAGLIEETTVARATMQIAIEYRLETSNAVSADIYNDLQMYSKILTESLIQVALVQ